MGCATTVVSQDKDYMVLGPQNVVPLRRTNIVRYLANKSSILETEVNGGKVRSTVLGFGIFVLGILSRAVFQSKT
ncbi:hypothetical protein KIN20_033915 [Parelaphostrongylus tenuis]|uniref:Uncharacterized protein n=1 Tax=Parelaphostrongylus tenuis TaxID=148309 RepID=A0AAD5R931_PARTN|nr:hypothetical protein KIN20_033915 [Parelaphostrongylus tenuis]